MEEGVIEENQQLSLEMVYLVPSPGVEDIAPVEVNDSRSLLDRI